MSTIKAIETQYKGYRFRSRTEARWAVFFDKLGVRWEYETEGYDLGKEGWYLPDFWLPDQSTFVEIKPQLDGTQQARKIYLAGKIYGKTQDWRGPLVTRGHGAWWVSTIEEYREIQRKKPWISLLGGHEYTGPYAIDEYGGHGCGHVTGFGHKGASEEEILLGCKTAIDRSDTLFAWIDTDDCYGTLLEIGYAYAKGKEIMIASKRYDPEKWMVHEMASKAIHANSAKDGFSFFFDQPSVHGEKCRKLSAEFSVILIEGVPDSQDKEYSASEYRKGERITGSGRVVGYVDHILVVPKNKGFRDEGSTRDALLAARSARFEHGERP